MTGVTRRVTRRVRALRASVAALALGLAQCCTPKHVEPPTPPPAPAPAPSLDLCDAYCARLEALVCEGAEGSPGPDEIMHTGDDVPCPKVCRDVMAPGVFKGDRACVDQSTTCQAADTCLLGE